MGGTDHGGAVGETSTYSTGTSAGAAVGMLCAVVLSEGGLLTNAYVGATVGAMVSLCLSGSSAGDSAAAGTSSPLPSAMGGRILPDTHYLMQEVLPCPTMLCRMQPPPSFRGGCRAGAQSCLIATDRGDACKRRLT